MDQPSSNAPMLAPRTGVAGWLPVWIKAVSQPREQTFVEITEQPGVSPTTAFLWIFLATTISAIVSGILTALLQALGFTSVSFLPGLEQYIGTVPADTSTVVGSLVGTLCFSPVAGIIFVVGFAIVVAVVQWIAKLFGGAGTYDKLAYAMAAISVPITFVTTVLSPFSVIPWLGVCVGLVSFGVGIYSLVLQVTAVKAVNRFGWGAALGSVFIPVLAILLFCACVIAIGMMVMGPAISEIFQQIQQGISP